MTFVQPLAVFADVMTSSNAFVVNPNYLIGSASNADPYGIATMELTDDDYYIQPFSSLGTVSNTVTGDLLVAYNYFNTVTETRHSAAVKPTYSGGRYHFIASVPSDCVIYQLGFRASKSNLPLPGTYRLGFDYASDFAYDVAGLFLYCATDPSNATPIRSRLFPSFDTFSGDIYFNSYEINLSNLSYLEFVCSMSESEGVRQLGGSFAISFTKVDSNSSAPSTGPDYSSSDYQSDVSGSLSDISSSIGDMSSSMDSAAESLEYISTSQNLIIQGIDNVIMHISDQLYAFWDQLYNLIHEPTYARLGDILDAIRNLDLEITIEMQEVTDAVNKMNQDMQGKLQNVQQTLTGGYDSSSMDSDNQELNSSLNEYEAAENELFDDAKENINSFEFDTDLGEFSTPLTDISYFLGSLFVGLGPMNVVISFSLTLTIAMVLIGWYRFKGGS